MASGNVHQKPPTPRWKNPTEVIRDLSVEELSLRCGLRIMAAYYLPNLVLYRAQDINKNDLLLCVVPQGLLTTDVPRIKLEQTGEEVFPESIKSGYRSLTQNRWPGCVLTQGDNILVSYAKQ